MSERGPKPSEIIDGPKESPSPDQELHEAVDGRGEVPSVSPEERAHLSVAFEKSPEISDYLSTDANIEAMHEAQFWVLEALTKRGVAGGDVTELTERLGKTIRTIELQVDDYIRRLLAEDSHVEYLRFHQGPGAYLKDSHAFVQLRTELHNYLIQSMRSYESLMTQDVEKKHGIELPDKYYFGELFFRGPELDFRARVTEWATKTDYYLRVKSLLSETQEQEKTGVKLSA